MSNLSTPTPEFRCEHTFRVGFDIPVDTILRFASNSLQQATSQGILADPKPNVCLKNLDEDEVEYLVQYYLDLNELSPTKGRSIISRAILKHLLYGGIRPAGDIVFLRTGREMVARDGANTLDGRVAALGATELFRTLDADGLAVLAEHSQVRRVSRNRTVIEQGAAGSSMFVLL